MILVILVDSKISKVIRKFEMGAVHGVYLKYVGLSALSYAGFLYFSGEARPDEVASETSRMLAATISNFCLGSAEVNSCGK